MKAVDRVWITHSITLHHIYFYCRLINSDGRRYWKQNITFPPNWSIWSSLSLLFYLIKYRYQPHVTTRIRSGYCLVFSVYAYVIITSLYKGLNYLELSAMDTFLNTYSHSVPLSTPNFCVLFVWGATHQEMSINPKISWKSEKVHLLATQGECVSISV